MPDLKQEISWYILGPAKNHCFTVGHENVHLGHENQNVFFFTTAPGTPGGKKTATLVGYSSTASRRKSSKKKSLMVGSLELLLIVQSEI